MSTLNLNNVSYSVKSGLKKKGAQKIIINDLTMEMRSGEMLAIIGSSGSGKTTILNMIAGRLGKGSVMGEILYNGEVRNPKKFKNILSYVEQDDNLNPYLTVRETIVYMAKLKLDSRKISTEEKVEKVNRYLDEMKLSGFKDSLVGSVETRGISGGEKKRTGIAAKLLTNPKILLLDEPTTGLDSNTAYSVIKLLKDFTTSKDVITISTIHQPNYKTFSLFDKVLLLSLGGIVYSGPISEAEKYFTDLGFKIPEYENPADFYSKIVSIDYGSEVGYLKSIARIERLKFKWAECGYKLKESDQELFNFDFNRSPSFDDSASVNVEDYDSIISSSSIEISRPSSNKIKWNNRWYPEMKILLERAWLIQIRERSFMISFFAISIAAMFGLGFTFYNSNGFHRSVQDITGLVFLLTLYLMLLIALPLLLILNGELENMKRERLLRLYRVSTYMVSLSLTMLPVVWASNFIMITGIYFIDKFQLVFYKYVLFIIIFSTTIICSFAFALAALAVAPNFETASIFAPLLLAFFGVFGGNLVNLNSIPNVLQWMKYISYFYYTYAGILKNQLTGLTYDCSLEPGAECYNTGEEVLVALEITISIWKCILLNFIIASIFFAVAYYGIRYRKRQKYLWI
ncbi:ATP-binding cassette sub-family G member 8 [Smittium mucronatum]|uniref:ATP-binding cassette sub-family G member 8 n=1 Tax=Smittium mucronatum TaxID=133383 RepID=A0A1R0GR78_9FUNG|nr:ATP-binding cassette sub-family G member 8 [Smittium mucronatum]